MDIPASLVFLVRRSIANSRVGIIFCLKISLDILCTPLMAKACFSLLVCVRVSTNFMVYIFQSSTILVALHFASPLVNLFIEIVSFIAQSLSF